MEKPKYEACDFQRWQQDPSDPDYTVSPFASLSLLGFIIHPSKIPFQSAIY